MTQTAKMSRSTQSLVSTTHPPTHPFNRPLAPLQHRPGSSRPRQFSQYHPTDPLLSIHVELKSPPKKRGRPSKKKPETAAGETAALPAADPNAPVPAATADGAAAPAGTSTGDAPAQPVKRGRGRPRKVSSAFPNRVRPSPCPTGCLLSPSLPLRRVPASLFDQQIRTAEELAAEEAKKNRPPAKRGRPRKKPKTDEENATVAAAAPPAAPTAAEPTTAAA